MMIDSSEKLVSWTKDPVVERALEGLHLSFLKLARKPKIEPEMEELSGKTVIELYEEKQQMQLLISLERSSMSKRAWRRNRCRKPYKNYKKRLALLREAINSSLWEAKFNAERDERIALQNYYLETEPW
ncbi:hypothetical protein [Hyella patelloides]|nr:hypothetical protein [Hyella patelloides]